MEQLIFWSEEHRVNPSVLPDSVKGWMTHGGISCSSILESLKSTSPAGSFGKMSPAFCRPTEDGILEPSSGRWGNSGMGSHTECLTLSISEFPRGAEESSLSDILETGYLPRRFFSSIMASMEYFAKNKPAEVLRRVSRASVEESRLKDCLTSFSRKDNSES